MINLLLEEQTEIIYGKLSNYDDFGDWIQCVSKEEKSRNEIFIGKQVNKFLHIF
jgi:hypothetical protein